MIQQNIVRLPIPTRTLEPHFIQTHNTDLPGITKPQNMRCCDMTAFTAILQWDHLLLVYTFT